MPISVYQFVHVEARNMVMPFEMHPNFRQVDYRDPDVILRFWRQIGQLPSNNCQVFGGGFESQGLPRGWRILGLARGLEGLEVGEDILIGTKEDPYAAVADGVKSRMTKLGGGCLNVLCVVR